MPVAVQPGRKALELAPVDAALKSRLDNLGAGVSDYWDFSDRRSRVEESRALFTYPAMMVGTMQRELMALISELQPGVTTVGDPFVGSGVVLTEAMYLGLGAVGQDINPLAVLLSRVKAECRNPDELASAGAQVLVRANAAGPTEVSSNRAIHKWFRPAAAEQLTRLQAAIRRQPAASTRRFLWTTLAETVRLTSNSRTSTYKLHVRPLAAIAGLPMPITTFSRILNRNIANQRAFHEGLTFKQRLSGGRYRRPIRVLHGDSASGFPVSCDLVVTSTPYGDNGTTVPYGQASYLPLQWVDAADIGPVIDHALLESAYEIDRCSLGGLRPRIGRDQTLARLRDISPALARCLDALDDMPRDRSQRVHAFVRDLDLALSGIVRAVRANGYLVFTMGNRRVGGREVPMDEILVDLLAARQVVHVAAVDRRIGSKRMAHRNSLAATMTRERTLLFRREAPQLRL